MAYDLLRSSDREPEFDDPVAARRHRQRRLALAYRVFGASRWGDQGDGHITARDPERSDHFWLARLGVPFGQVTVADLVLVAPDGSVVEGDGDINRTAYYIHADGSLRTAPPEGAAGAGSSDGESQSYRYDPEHPVPSIGGTITSGAPIMVGGAFDQREREDFFGSTEPYRPLAERDDVLVFQTEPLAEDIEVTGPFVVKLWISSDCPDTDFTAKLVDVYPPNEDFPGGFDMNIADALVRASYRDDRHTRDLIDPGRIYRLVIRPFATANVFKKGHRIRVDISSSNFPRFDVNPNTGEPLGKHRRQVSADNTIYHEQDRASHIILPILPARPPEQSTWE